MKPALLKLSHVEEVFHFLDSRRPEVDKAMYQILANDDGTERCLGADADGIYTIPEEAVSRGFPGGGLDEGDG
jgi:hypothetical protein